MISTKFIILGLLVVFQMGATNGSEAFDAQCKERDGHINEWGDCVHSPIPPEFKGKAWMGSVEGHAFADCALYECLPEGPKPKTCNAQTRQASFADECVKKCQETKTTKPIYCEPQ